MIKKIFKDFCYRGLVRRFFNELMFSQTKPSVSGRIFLEHPTFFYIPTTYNLEPRAFILYLWNPIHDRWPQMPNGSAANVGEIHQEFPRKLPSLGTSLFSIK